MIPTYQQDYAHRAQNQEGIFFQRLCMECADEWNAYTRHPFVTQMAEGTLPAKCFQYYLIQLYLFTKHYSRAYAMAVVKSEHLDDLREAASHVDFQLNYELEIHMEYYSRWGIDAQQLEDWPEDDANRLYARYILDQGLSGDLLDILIALAPCSLGYAEIGARLYTDPDVKLINNPYRDWIELYGGTEFQEAAITMRKYIDRVALRRGLDLEKLDNERFQSIKKNFANACDLEVKFWEMGLNPPKTMP